MDFTLLSGVVRNRKYQLGGGAHRSFAADVADDSSSLLLPRAQSMNSMPSSSAASSSSSLSSVLALALERCQELYQSAIRVHNPFCRKFTLRVHKFIFQWDLAIHLGICIVSLCPFFFTGDRLYTVVPLSVWGLYHVLFLLGPKHANLVLPGFGKLKHSFKSSFEEFFSPKLLPVLSVSFLLVALSLGVTGHRLGGPPLCYRPCGSCLANWDRSVRLDERDAELFDASRYGCGYANGKEMLSYYTMAQTSSTLFFTVVVAMAVCLAWRVAEEELDERTHAEQWLKHDSPIAHELRAEVIAQVGAPGASVRPEGGPVWVFFGVTAAVTFTLLGWHNWFVLPPSPTASLLILLNLLTIVMTTLILHLGFFGRLLALYKRNYLRVACMTSHLRSVLVREQLQVDAWWNCRNFVLNEDLSLDYDIGGLAVSLTFLINVIVFLIVIVQLCREGYPALLEPPGSYCAYACMYITTCLIKIFTLATNTYEEQRRHSTELQMLLLTLSQRAATAWAAPGDGERGIQEAPPPLAFPASLSADALDAGLFIDDEDEPPPPPPPPPLSAPLLLSSAERMSPKPAATDAPPIAADADGENKPPLSSRGHLSPHPRLWTRGKQPDASGADRGEALKLSDEELLVFPSGPSPRPALSKPQSSRTLTKAAVARRENSAQFGTLTAALPVVAGADALLSSAAAPADLVPPAHGEPLPVLLDLPHVPPPPVAGPAPPHLYHNNNNYIHSHSHQGNGSGHSIPMPSAVRSVSSSLQSHQQTLTEIISQIRKYDPYPCILGIPVMPALFTTCKSYIFIFFLLIGVRTMVSCLRQL